MSVQPLSRRALLGGRFSRADTILPPGASRDALHHCTGCNLCTERCPTSIIHLVDGLPSVDLHVGECTFCGECREACPEPVFPPDAELRFDHRAEVKENCLALNRIACQSCGEACPVEAIRFAPRIGTAFIPLIDSAACNGCGACLQVCPVGAITMRSKEPEAVHG